MSLFQAADQNSYNWQYNWPIPGFGGGRVAFLDMVVWWREARQAFWRQFSGGIILA